MLMRSVSAQTITQTVARLCIEANTRLPADVTAALAAARAGEDWPCARDTLDLLQQNLAAAAQNELPICQDTGMACVFVRLGGDVRIEGDLAKAVNEGVKKGYEEGFLRKSIVADPLRRENTGDNTPAMLTVEYTAGESLEITVAPKGAGSENMSRLAMLRPADGEEGVRQFVLETVRLAGANPCPPVIVGVGLGGTSEAAAALAKEALLRPVGQPGGDPFYAAMEAEALARINALGIGPQGLGGETTALAVHIRTYPTHIAGLPCCVNLGCHVTRHATVTL